MSRVVLQRSLPFPQLEFSEEIEGRKEGRKEWASEVGDTKSIPVGKVGYETELTHHRRDLLPEIRE